MRSVCLIVGLTLCEHSCVDLGAEVKKELGTISGILVDIPQDDELKGDLEKLQRKLTKLGLELPVCQCNRNSV